MAVTTGEMLHFVCVLVQYTGMLRTHTHTHTHAHRRTHTHTHSGHTSDRPSINKYQLKPVIRTCVVGRDSGDVQRDVKVQKMFTPFYSTTGPPPLPLCCVSQWEPLGLKHQFTTSVTWGKRAFLPSRLGLGAEAPQSGRRGEL